MNIVIKNSNNNILFKKKEKKISVTTPKVFNKIRKETHCVETVYFLCQYENICYREMIIDFNV